MNLNSIILFDNMKDFPIIKHTIDKSDLCQLQLEYPILYDNDTLFTSNRVYIAHASDLTETPVIRKKSTLLCIGIPAELYFHLTFDIICFDENISITMLMNAVQTIFNKYNRWEQHLQELLIKDAPLKELGNISLPVLQNPITFIDCTNRSLFLSFDSNQEPLPDDAVMEDNSYLAPDEANLMLSDPEYLNLINHKEPTLFSDKLFDYKTLVQNIFEDNEFIGRVCVYDIYRPFRQSDYPLIKILSGYIHHSILMKHLLDSMKPQKYEELFLSLLNEEEHIPDFDTILRELSWEPDDTYICAALHIISDSNLPKAPINTNVELLEIFDAILLKNSHSFKYDGDTILITNLSQAGINKEQAFYKFNRYLNTIKGRAGLSVEFQNLRKLSVYYRQALYSLCHLSQSGSFGCTQYSSHILEFIQETLLKNHPIACFIPDCLARLIAHDEKNGSHYLETLQIFLKNNMNITHTVKELYIHRSTFLYRIDKIKEIMGTDLTDPQEQTALQIAFLLMDKTRE